MESHDRIAVVVSWVVCIFAVVMLQAIFRVFVGGTSQLAVVASTLLFVVLLFPARVRLRDFIDRRLRRSRARRLARQHQA
jgi:hypothetical protein